MLEFVLFNCSWNGC